MSRAIPLAKIVMWMIVVYTACSVLLSLLWVYVVESEKPEPTQTPLIMRYLDKEINHGVLSGVLTGLAMALYAAVDRWTIRRLAYFRAALLAVAAIVALLYVGGSFHIAYVQLFMSFAVSCDCVRGKVSDENCRANHRRYAVRHNCQVYSCWLHDFVRSGNLLAPSLGTKGKACRANADPSL